MSNRVNGILAALSIASIWILLASFINKGNEHGELRTMLFGVLYLTARIWLGQKD